MTLLFRLFPSLGHLDAANLLTSGNVLLAMAGIALAIAGRIELCAVAIFFAALCDYLDGHIARRFLADRHDNREFGKQLDTLADLLNFGVVPAVALISASHGAAAMIAPAVLLVLSCVLRLAHFSLIAVPGGYIGIPTTYSGFLLANLLLLTGSGRLAESWLPIAALLLAVLQILNIPVRKFPAPVVVAAMSLLFSITALFVYL